MKVTRSELSEIMVISSEAYKNRNCSIISSGMDAIPSESCTACDRLEWELHYENYLVEDEL